MKDQWINLLFINFFARTIDRLRPLEYPTRIVTLDLEEVNMSLHNAQIELNNGNMIISFSSVVDSVTITLKF